MSQSQGPIDIRVLAVIQRMRELIDYRAPWHRTLWSVGTILELREILDYMQPQSDIHGSHSIDKRSVEPLIKDVQQRIKEDIGVGVTQEIIDELLKKALDMIAKARNRQVKLAPADWYRLQFFVEQTDNTYLANWAQALRNRTDSQVGNAHFLSEESIARHLAETLLDKGVSPDRLHRWLTRFRKEAPIRFEEHDPQSNADWTANLIEGAATIASAKEAEFQVGVPFQAYSLHDPLPSGADCRTSEGGVEWLDKNCEGWRKGSSQRRSVNVADWESFLIISVKSWDEWGAAEKAGELIARVEARISLTQRRLRYAPLPMAWVSGNPTQLELFGSRRKVLVPFLDQGRIEVDIEKDSILSPVADALMLLASMRSSTVGASLSSGWAAMEALLADGEEKYRTAYQMSTILAASLPRAELTSLVHADINSPKLVRQLNGARDVSGKIGILEQRIRDDYKYLGFARITDQMALSRFEQIMTDPATKLGRVRWRLESTFNRLYRHRNMAMHDGRLVSIATSASLRLAPTLVAAGLDRILAAGNPGQRSRPKRPLELAIYADERLKALEPDKDSPRLARLLD